jgi:HK97 family phage prohead protease
MKKDYIMNIDSNAERRSMTGSVEIRQVNGENPTIAGVACVFDQPTDMGWYIEKVAKGAFDGADMSDVVALFNHEEEELLSRTTGKADDLNIAVTSKGLEYKFLAKNECSMEVAENISLGFIRGSSFAFSCTGEEWEYEVMQLDGQRKDVRTITKIGKLYDVSPVTHPAYQQTSVGLRKRQAEKQPDLIDLKINNKAK